MAEDEQEYNFGGDVEQPAYNFNDDPYASPP